MAVDMVKGCDKTQGRGWFLGGTLKGSLSMADRTKVAEMKIVPRTGVRQEEPSPSGQAGAQGSGLHGSVPARPAAMVRRSG